MILHKPQRKHFGIFKKGKGGTTADDEKEGYPCGCFYLNGCRPAGTLRLSERKGRADRGRSSRTEVHVN